jgi:hypothetical protein
MQPFFSMLQAITHKKTKWEDLTEEERESFNNWIVNKFISMHEDYCGLVNVIQKNTWQMSKKNLYNVYLKLLPNNNVFFKYIKGKKSTKYNVDDLKLLSTHLDLSVFELKENYDMLDHDHLADILYQIKGKDK